MAARPRKLAAVPKRAASAKPVTLREAADRSERAALIILRDMTATQLQALSKIQDQKASTAAAFAAVMKQFRELDAAVRAIDAKAKQQAGEDGDADAADGWDDDSL